MNIYIFFFFQAEDGIRDLTVTGVQTCALPILRICRRKNRGCTRRNRAAWFGPNWRDDTAIRWTRKRSTRGSRSGHASRAASATGSGRDQQYQAFPLVIAPTRWLAMTVLTVRRVIGLSQNLRPRVKKPSAQSQVERASFVLIRRGRPEWRLRYARSKALPDVIY